MFLALGALLLTQCQGGPGRVLEVRPQQASFVAFQNRGGVNLELVNSSSVRSSKADALRRQRPGLKIVADAEVQLLLDALAHLEFFELARSQAHGEARSWVVVQHGGQTWVGSGYGTGKDGARVINKFAAWVDVVRAFYNRTENFSTARLRKDELENASREINEASRGVKAKRKGGNRHP